MAYTICTMKDKAQLIKPLEAPVNAKICAKVAEPKMIKNDITVMRKAPSSDLTQADQVISP